MLVRGLNLPTIEHAASLTSLYPHQVAMWEGWEQNEATLLAAKTGTGKTRAAMLPILRYREYAIAIYPTNELLKDQVRAVASFFAEEGVKPLVLTPEIWEPAQRSKQYSSADHILIPVDAALVDDWQKAMRCKSRGETLRRLLNPDKPKIIFTNPDILFLILGLQYHAEPFEALHYYKTLIMDEFHLYQGVELAHALAMITLAREFGFFKRLILLSATPHPEVVDLLTRSINPLIIDPSKIDYGSSSQRVAVHPVEITPIQVAGGDPVEVIVSQLKMLRSRLEVLRDENPDDNYLPAVVIVNSVMNAIRLEDRLVDEGFSRDALAIIRGLSHRSIRTTKGKLLALGTSAIEVGVDFRCDYLLFEASESASFLQRFGRVGRHRPGRAIVLVPPNAFQGMMSLPNEVERSTFEERIYAWYPSTMARPWFVTTEYGMITIRAQAENLLSTIQKDGDASPEVLTILRDKIEAMLNEHSKRLGCQAQNLQAKSAFERCASGKQNVQWINTYRKINRFRTSLPSIKVHDFTEQHRRQDWNMGEYEADLATLLKRAIGLSWNEKLGMLTIRGLGKYRSVHASDLFDNNDCGIVLETKNYPNLRIYQDGDTTPISDLMGRENHIFVVIPKATVENEIDWRLPVFESGHFLLAFDGAALLLFEIWKRQQ